MLHGRVDGNLGPSRDPNPIKMWQYKILAVSWLCVLWTKVDSAFSEDTSTPKYLEGTLGPTSTEQNPKELSLGSVDVTKGYSQESTVRSFFPIKGKQKWMRRGSPPVEEMLFFNVSIINDNEEVSLAELHIHRRRIGKIYASYHKRFLPLPYRVVLYQVQPNYRHRVGRDARTMKLGSLPVSYATKSGWHTLDVTAILRELLINAQGPVELFLGVQFEIPKSLAKLYSPLLTLKHFLKPLENSELDYPFKTSSYLVVFSDIDPYFDEFEDGDDDYGPEEMDNDIPDSHAFRERHLKHKIFKVKSSQDKDKARAKEKSKIKYKAAENEVYKSDYGRKREDVVRHKSKHRASDVKRSKADELALQQKNKLKSLPFLHTNEVEEIRQTSRRLARSIRSGNSTSESSNRIPGMPGRLPKPKDIRRTLNNLIKEVAGSQGWNESSGGICSNRQLTITLRDVDFGAGVASPASFVTTYCSGWCSNPETDGKKTCGPGSRRGLDMEFYDGSGKTSLVELGDFLVTDCLCR